MLRPSLGVLLATVLVTATLPAQQPYVVTDEGTQPYTSIATPGNRLVVVSSCDECVQQVTLPFPFPWFGEREAQLVTVSANGQLNLDGRLDPECCEAAAIPDRFDQNDDAIRLVKEDLNPSVRGSWHAAVLGAPPSRRWVLELVDIPFFFDGGSASAQLTLEEDTGAVVLHYAPIGALGIDPTTMMPNTFSAGLEAAGGLVGAPAVAGPHFDPDGIAGTWPASHRVRFSPPTDPDLRIVAIRPSASILDPGATLDVEVEVQKLGRGDRLGVRVDLFSNPLTPPQPGAQSPQFALVDLASTAGATAVATFSGLSAPGPGAWELHALVDTLAVEVESDETNNAFGPVLVFQSTPQPLPFRDSFDGPLAWAIDPPMPAGGAGAPCRGATPCEHARATLDPAEQSSCATGGTGALALDCDNSFDWLGLAAPAIAQDPDAWELPSPAGMPSHVGSAFVRLDTSAAAVLRGSLSLRFEADEETDQQLVVEVRDARGWRSVAGAGATAGGGRIYRPSCPPGGCGGATPWLCDTLDLARIETGGEVLLRLRWLTRTGGTTQVLVDEVEITGDPTGVRFARELPATVVQAPAGGEVVVLPFRSQPVGEAATLHRLLLRADGSLDDSAFVRRLQLWRDRDGTRTLTPADTLEGERSGFTIDDGSEWLSLTSPSSHPAGQVARWLLTVELDAGAPPDDDLALTLETVDATTAMGAPADVGGVPMAADRVVVERARLLLTEGSIPPQPVVCTPGATGVVVAQWQARATAGAVDLQGLSVRAVGNGDDAAGLATVHLVMELPGSINGRLDPGEPTLSTRTFAVDDGIASFVFGAPLALAPGATAALLYVVDTTPGAATGGARRTFQGLVDGPAEVLAGAAEVVLPATGLGAHLEVIDGCPLSRCGDCDVDGDVDIVDALIAAQHAVALLVLDPNPHANCNVTGLVFPDPAAAVDILDALQIAQAAAGLASSLSCCP